MYIATLDKRWMSAHEEQLYSTQIHEYTHTWRFRRSVCFAAIIVVSNIVAALCCYWILSNIVHNRVNRCFLLASLSASSARSHSAHLFTTYPHSGGMVFMFLYVARTQWKLVCECVPYDCRCSVLRWVNFMVYLCQLGCSTLSEDRNSERIGRTFGVACACVVLASIWMRLNLSGVRAFECIRIVVGFLTAASADDDHSIYLLKFNGGGWSRVQKYA